MKTFPDDESGIADRKYRNLSNVYICNVIMSTLILHVTFK